MKKYAIFLALLFVSSTAICNTKEESSVNQEITKTEETSAKSSKEAEKAFAEMFTQLLKAVENIEETTETTTNEEETKS